MDKKNQLKVYLAAITFSVTVGFSFLAVKICVPIASTIEILAFRYNAAFVGMIALLLLRIVKIEFTGKEKKPLMLAAVFYILFMVLQAAGLIFSTSVESAILFAIIPIIAKIIAGFVLNEKSTLQENIFTCISVSALIFMIVMGNADISVNMFGIVLLLLSSVSMAYSNVMMRYVRKQHKPFEVTFAISLIGFVAFNFAYLSQLAVTASIADYFAPAGNHAFLIATIYLGIPSLVISSWMMSYMLAHMEAVKATIFGNLSTAISIVAGTLILREPLAPYHIICAILIIAGVIGVSFVGNKRSVKQNAEV